MLNVGEMVANTESDAILLAVEHADKEDEGDALDDKLDMLVGEGGGGTVMLAIDEDELIALADCVRLSEGELDALGETDGDLDAEALKDARVLLDAQFVSVFDKLRLRVPEPDLDGVTEDEVERLIHCVEVADETSVRVPLRDEDPDVLTDME